MIALQREREDLVAADRHLAAGEQRIAEQIALIQRLLEETMASWQDHRRLILDAIARHERAGSNPPRTNPGLGAP